MARPRKDAASDAPRRPPATTVEARENQLIAMAYDAAEQQIADGSASAQVITHFLKMGTVREKMEREKILNENALLKAKVADMASQSDQTNMYAAAIAAMSSYQGREVEYDVDG